MTKRIFTACLFFSAATIYAATPLIDSPVESLTLTTGEVLHGVQAKAFSSKSVLVRYSDGAKTIPYDQFPAEYRDALTAHKPAAPKTSAVAQPTTPAPKLAATNKKSAPAPNRLPNERYKGLALLSSSVNGATGTVEIYNDTTEPVRLDPSSIIAMTDNGKVVVGRHWVEMRQDGNIGGALQAGQTIAPKSAVTLSVSFLGIPAGATLTQVDWSQN